ncbi:nitrate reductase [Gloeophyllum trabeum ATCC 11539]|uniref:Nitrate reductase n=1 Tax=Gloeophyllum trabeum (strain ATCC 11539 / FP-39264 / Madison 617) TaxID=670483 RepID=S7Q0X0_GLOTA|nr:nitrate reductase [Gloeophyllum trabeum ATCC 11539]EPQ53162.1 nitrate reductase [Gloeophyllum trabeum ATCC 11539]
MTANNSDASSESGSVSVLSDYSDLSTSSSLSTYPSGGYPSLPQPFLPVTFHDPGRQGSVLPEGLPPLPKNENPIAVAEEDAETPDKWIKRNPNLIRLTGKHPFNTEARLPELFNAGFLTPAHLHFVRNHGAVPRVNDQMRDSWTIRVHGLVEREANFSLEELAQTFRVVTLPVTLVCAGNRRKEQNAVRKSLGFSWGAAGVSTALWTGVYLSDVLEHVKPLRGQAKHVVFEGCDSLPNGPYGTSQKLSWAKSKDKGMLIAWAMNGLPLEPDHGFPVRLIVPGQIGGRSVKWLKRIEVSAEESQHYDNKVLPTQVLPDQARAERHWWYDPRELNVNSAIARPDHNEVLTVSEGESYLIQGYAYSGGGRKITRVEVSLDQGDVWKLAKIDYPEDLFRTICHHDPVYGTLDLTERDTSFCWCFWSYRISHASLADCDAIMVRAMDEGLALQPRDMYWTALGMMNNWWFRVAVSRTVVDGEIQLLFEHPTLAGTASGGWMERMKAEGKDIGKPSWGDKHTAVTSGGSFALTEEIAMTNPKVKRDVTLEELRRQDRAKPWFVVKGEVYDGTPFLKEHPGGADSILLVAGEDATDDFMAIHSPEGRARLAEYHIGTLTGGNMRPEGEPDDISVNFLNKRAWKSVRLTEIRQLNHDSWIYRFSLPTQTRQLGLPVGQHVFVRLRRKDTSELVQRAYTPVSWHKSAGSVEFLIKIYHPSPQYPAGGKMTVGFHQLTIGDLVELKGPLGSFEWRGSGVAVWKGVERRIKNLGLICGGSGITPILQVLRRVLHDENDRTRLWLISANKTEADILCRDELEVLQSTHGNNRFRLHYTLTTCPNQWKYGVGRISEDMIAEHMPSPSHDGLILVCGPDGMISHCVKPALRRLGWDTEQYLVVF